MKLLVTGAAGFIGFHTSQLLLERDDEVVGLDNLDDWKRLHNFLSVISTHAT